MEGMNMNYMPLELGNERCGQDQGEAPPGNHANSLSMDAATSGWWDQRATVSTGWSTAPRVGSGVMKACLPRSW